MADYRWEIWHSSPWFPNIHLKQYDKIIKVRLSNPFYPCGSGSDGSLIYFLGKTVSGQHLLTQKFCILERLLFKLYYQP